MVYGVSGSTKTSQLYLLAKWLLEKEENKGKFFRMIHSDGGGYAPFEDSGMIDRGEVQIYDLSSSKHPLGDYRKLSAGYWPRKAKDKAGNPALYFQKDENCMTTKEEWDKCLGYIIEGMASTGEALKAYCSNQKETSGGMKEAWSFTTEDGETIQGVSLSHYGVVQREMYERHMLGFNCLPIRWLMYSSLHGKGEDKKLGNETVYGPQVCGNASTPAVSQWFMDCLRLNVESWKDKEGNVQEGVVAWFQKHNDSLTNVLCLAKARVMPEKYPDLLRYFPNGFVPLTYDKGIVNYFRVLDKLKEN